MKRQRESATCVALRTRGPLSGGRVREFRCYPSAEAAALQRRGLVDLIAEYDSDEECAAACGTLTMLPPEVGEQILAGVPLGALPAMARVSRTMRQRVATDIEAERYALGALRDQYPILVWYLYEQPVEQAPEEEEEDVPLAPRIRSVDQLCAFFALPCARPYGELLARLQHELWVPPDRRPGAESDPIELGAAMYTVTRHEYGGDVLANVPENASFAQRGVPATLPSSRLARMVLLPGESVRFANDVPGQLMAFDPNRIVVAEVSVSFLFQLSAELLPTTPPTGPVWPVWASYTVPPPPNISQMDILSRDGRGLRNYLTAVEDLFGLPDGDLSIRRIPGGAEYSLRGGDDSLRRITDVIRRSGLPVSVLVMNRYTPIA